MVSENETKSTDIDTSTDTNKNTRYYRYSIPSTGTRPISTNNVMCHAGDPWFNAEWKKAIADGHCNEAQGSPVRHADQVPDSVEHQSQHLLCLSGMFLETDKHAAARLSRNLTRYFYLDSKSDCLISFIIN